MTDIAIHQPKLIVPKLWLPAAGIEELFPALGSRTRRLIGDLLLRQRRGGAVMAGSLCNFSSKAWMDEVFGATNYVAAATLYFGLWTAAIDDTLLGNTANEAAYTSYARMGLTNNTTIFDAATGSTTATKQFPADATKSWAACTGGSSVCTYMGILDGNAGTSADKGIAWCSINSETIDTGDTPQLAVDAVTVVQD